MKGKFLVWILVILLVVSFFLIPHQLLFYDGPEYINIVSNNSFLQSLTLGHLPIHPGFIGIFWFFVKLLGFVGIAGEYAGNLLAYFSGILSLVFFYSLTARILKKKKIASLAVLIMAITPVFWLLSINLLIESVVLPIFILASLVLWNYLEKKSVKLLIIFGTLLVIMAASHIQMWVWFPVFFVLPLVHSKRADLRRILPIVIGMFLSVIFSLSIYFLLSYINSPQHILGYFRSLIFGRFTTHYSLRSFFGILRIIRNFWVTTSKGYGLGLTFAFGLSFILSRKNTKYLLGLTIILIALFVSGAVWTGDFMPRRVVFGLPYVILFVFLSAKEMKHRALIGYLMFSYLVPIFIFNALLYTKPSPLAQMRKMQENLESGQILIRSFYVYPFSPNYDGTSVWNEVEWNNLGDDEKEKKQIFLDSQTLYAPELILTMDNVHVTSLYNPGRSNYKKAIEGYNIDIKSVESAGDNIYTMVLVKSSESFTQKLKINRDIINPNTALLIGKAPPQKTVFVYSKTLKNRLYRRRMDYGDMAVWTYYLLMNKRDPIGWTYTDSDGVFVYPVDRALKDSILVKGADEVFLVAN